MSTMAAKPASARRETGQIRARFMLDTNICIYLMKQTHPEVQRQFAALHANELCISIITHGELSFGACKSQQSARAAKALDAFAQTLGVLELDAKASAHYGEIRAHLEAKGLPIGNNLREFSRVPRLAVANWLLPPSTDTPCADLL
jgi:tRNA(fMet)-specific endonuclease VapC